MFNGRWLIFEFNKSFQYNVCVIEKGFEKNINNDQEPLVKKNELKKIILEYEEFNQKFDTYADNEHEAFYILTPKLIEQILKLKFSINEEVMFCFTDNKLHVAIYDNHNVFEPINPLKTLNKEQEQNKINEEIEKITMIVDELQLSNNLYKGE